MLVYMYFGEFGIVSTSNPLIDFFINSHHFSACTYTVRRNYVLITQAVKGLKLDCTFYQKWSKWSECCLQKATLVL